MSGKAMPERELNILRTMLLLQNHETLSAYCPHVLSCSNVMPYAEARGRSIEKKEGDLFSCVREVIIVYYHSKYASYTLQALVLPRAAEM